MRLLLVNDDRLDDFCGLTFFFLLKNTLKFCPFNEALPAGSFLHANFKHVNSKSSLKKLHFCNTILVQQQQHAEISITIH